MGGYSKTVEEELIARIIDCCGKYKDSFCQGCPLQQMYPAKNVTIMECYLQHSSPYKWDKETIKQLLDKEGKDV